MLCENHIHEVLFCRGRRRRRGPLVVSVEWGRVPFAKHVISITSSFSSAARPPAKEAACRMLPNPPNAYSDNKAATRAGETPQNPEL